jgi:hypothetical protein
VGDCYNGLPIRRETAILHIFGAIKNAHQLPAGGAPQFQLADILLVIICAVSQNEFAARREKTVNPLISDF